MCNEDIKHIIRKSRFFNYELADKLEISESTFSGWFRNELSDEKKKLILEAIEKLERSEVYVDIAEYKINISKT